MLYNSVGVHVCESWLASMPTPTIFLITPFFLGALSVGVSKTNGFYTILVHATVLGQAITMTQWITSRTPFTSASAVSYGGDRLTPVTFHWGDLSAAGQAWSLICTAVSHCLPVLTSSPEPSRRARLPKARRTACNRSRPLKKRLS